MKKKRLNTREIGLEAAALCSKYLFKSDHLHYGLWTGDLHVDVSNLRAAQEQYVAFILTHFPHNIHSVLDVGCGTGGMAAAMINLGYRVDGLSPSRRLNEYARLRIGSQGCVYDGSFEALATEKRYDLILFSESFQYVKQVRALEHCQTLLNKGGHIMICDFFRRPGIPKGSIGGGHQLDAFYAYINSLPFECITDIDITDYTSPNLDLVHDFMRQVSLPIAEMLIEHFKQRYPVFASMILWLYRKKINDVQTKYLDGKRTGAEFARTKSYHLMVYQKMAKLQAIPNSSKCLIGNDHAVATV